MERLTICWSLVLLISLIGIFQSEASNLGLKKSINLTYYVHDTFVKGSETSVVVATVGENKGDPAFGDIRVFHSPIRATEDRNSLLLGNTGGTLADISHLENNTYHASFSVSYNSSEYVGTFSVQGRVTPGTTTWEVPIIAGTGDFRGAQGYGIAKAYNVTDISDVLFKYDVFLNVEVADSYSRAQQTM
ncbi:protein MpDIR49 [Marchantia polymorpha subsp. ruderalis]|uniref:Dirigent protein n=2 Tax=Marchantia polymorpha TaxID=3197 RepID=A0AAF6B445_MARPO|nr:hypothetical protein MARPO_0121s0040 [Marchantia polymorpha]BBN06779.1 hypothetical protein Mp_3g23830 [Marchantia polymorpha subsp. ruderalis]|eukprot:PTQ30696.1 hypothetical protein MARPO_0121s0040 [Marchantia polymorpha]